MTNQRPAGVTILAMIHLIGGVLTVGVSAIVFGGIFNADAAATPGTEISTRELLAASVVIFISGLAGLFTSYGLFNLKGWGRILAIVFTFINVIYSLINLFKAVNIVGAFVGIFFSGFILYYLNTVSVKRAFGRV
ncbi:DUF2127 domain-containing protein [Nodosilinea sp. AN01ver1]|uniref:DUF2127 domain-containing protein n=1 Tax=Nodosilinea sp. AN01ver1 TaxID=3423362 RepID=UPI003D32262D